MFDLRHDPDWNGVTTITTVTTTRRLRIWISKSVPLELERDIVARQCWQATTFKTYMLQRAPDYKINGRDDYVPFIRHSRSRRATKLDPINDYDLCTRLRRVPKMRRWKWRVTMTLVTTTCKHRWFVFPLKHCRYKTYFKIIGHAPRIKGLAGWNRACHVTG